jgi:hypothetical protein
MKKLLLLGIIAALFITVAFAKGPGGGTPDDQGWETPVGVVSYSSFEGVYKPKNTIDNDWKTKWAESYKNDVDDETGNWEWYITYDMGIEKTIYGIRILSNEPGTLWPCNVGIIRVCNELPCTNTNSLNSQSCSLNRGVWSVCSFPEKPSGRYIEIRGGSGPSYSCFDVSCDCTKLPPGKCGYLGCTNRDLDNRMYGFYEFDVCTDRTYCPLSTS